MSKKILVTGGSGMVGRSLQDIMSNATYLSSRDCDLTDPVAVDYLIKYTKPDVIIHLAAKVGGIMDNINKPAEYFDDNVIMNTLLLKSSQKYGVERFIGILSTCIYPDVVEEYPMTEDMLHIGPPTQTNFSYGYAKRCLAVQIDAYNKQYGTKYQYLTPCNLYGQYDKWGENSHFVAALIKKIMFACANGESEVQLFGTGKPLRQFMHSDDLAWVIKYCIEHDIYDSFNVATIENISIGEIAEIARHIVGGSVVQSFNYDSTKPDGQFRKDVSIKKMNDIIPTFEAIPLKFGIKKVFDYLLDNQIMS